MRPMNKAGLFGILGAMIMVSWGCSGSSSGGGSGGGASFDCSKGCETLLKTGCPNDKMETCVADCNTDLAEAGTCVNDFKAFLSCAVTLPMYCDANGEAEVDDQAAFDSCFSPLIAYTRCGACLAEAGDTACESCQKSSCCAERQAVYDDANFKAYFTCYRACTDSTCQQNCISQYPTIQDKGLAVQTCRTNKCSSACP